MRIWRLTVSSLVLVVVPQAAADVAEVEVLSRTDVLEGRPFGEAGAYEKLEGVVRFAWDPANPANDRIVDLDLAPTNIDGNVEAVANFMVLQPKDPAKRSGVGLLEVSNRGGKAVLGLFNRTLFSRSPVREADFGDGLLMEMGLTVIWVGWEWDVPARRDLLRIEVPTVRDADGSTLYGYARADWVVTSPTSTLGLGHRSQQPYPVARPGDDGNVLTVRAGRDAPREVVPREKWRFARRGPDGLAMSPDTIYMEEGFTPGMIYELVYHTKDPRVVGLGLAAVRDTISYAKHDEACPFPVDVGIAYGVSQSGRFLRHFLYQGFNADEKGRIAFEGMFVHTAGAGRGSFNHRFAQPSRDAHRFSAFFYPTDIFPFTSREETDPVTGTTDGLLAGLSPEHRPKVFYTNTGYEYWGRAAALIHVSPDGTEDVAPLENERIYHLASGQHYVSRLPPDQARIGPEARAWYGNPLDFNLTNRALLGHLVAWVTEGTSPPESRYPTIASGTLVALERYQFPEVPGVRAPGVAHTAYRADYGPRFESEGIVDKQPPELGETFPVLVPRVDEFGNELGGVPTVEIRAPLASYTPWSLRIGMPGEEDEMRDFVGMILPLPRIERGQEEGDARPPIEVMYPGREEYLERAREEAKALVREGWLLEHDVDAAVERAGATWDWGLER